MIDYTSHRFERGIKNLVRLFLQVVSFVESVTMNFLSIMLNCAVYFEKKGKFEYMY